MRLILGLLWTMALFCFLSAEPGRGDSVPRPAANTLKDWPEWVEGLGLDVQRAKENAVKEAQKEIVACLRRQNPPLKCWVPSEKYIRMNLLAKEEKGEELKLEPGIARRWIVYLKAPDWDTFNQLDRKAQALERTVRAQERILILGKVLAGLLILLVAAVGYIRLDDWTQGYYTRWLQLAGAGVVAATCAGLWLLS